MRNFFRPSAWSHQFVVTMCATIACPLLFWFQAQIPLAKPLPVMEPKILSASFFKFTTLGYWPAAVDWMWIQTLQIIGDGDQSPGLKLATFQFYEMATDLDPRFYELYEQAGVLFSFFFHSPDESIHFLEKGIQHASPTWAYTSTLYLLVAYLYSYDKKDWNKAKEYYLRAAEVPGAPDYLKRMQIWLKEDGSEKELAKRVLTTIMNQTQDEVLKAEYQKRLNDL